MDESFVLCESCEWVSEWLSLTSVSTAKVIWTVHRESCYRLVMLLNNECRLSDMRSKRLCSHTRLSPHSICLPARIYLLLICLLLFSCRTMLENNCTRAKIVKMHRWALPQRDSWAACCFCFVLFYVDYCNFAPIHFPTVIVRALENSHVTPLLPWSYFFVFLFLFVWHPRSSL
jgi:hypothetical protein